MYNFEHEADVKLLVIARGTRKARSLYLTKEQWYEVADLIRKQGENAEKGMIEEEKQSVRESIKKAGWCPKMFDNPNHIHRGECQS